MMTIISIDKDVYFEREKYIDSLLIHIASIKRDNLDETPLFFIHRKGNLIKISIGGVGTMSCLGLKIKFIDEESKLCLLVKIYIEKGALVIFAVSIFLLMTLLLTKGKELSNIIFAPIPILILFTLICWNDIRIYKSKVINFIKLRP